jgi:hypothetical protein
MSRPAVDRTKQNWPILFRQMYSLRPWPHQNVWDNLNVAHQFQQSSSLLGVMKVDSRFFHRVA